MTSSNENIFRVTGHLCREVTGEFPAQRPVMRSFDVFFDLRLNNGWVNNHEAGDLRRHHAHYDVIVMLFIDKIFRETFQCNGMCYLVDITGATILVPCHAVKSLQLIWRSGTRRWHLRVPDLQMSCGDLT